MRDKPYSYGGYCVTVAPDGAIKVKSGDLLSHYSMAIYHDFNDMAKRFGRMVGGGVKSFAEIPADIDMIVAGETLYDIKTNKGGGGGDSPPPTGRGRALTIIDQFERRTGPQAFTQFSRAQVATELRDRVTDPRKIGQDGAGVCGPTALLFNLAQDDPAGYARLVIDLYEYGHATVGKLSVSPTRQFVAYVPSARVPHPADWIPEGSLRNSEDWGNLYPALGEPMGPSTPWAIARWFKDAGYTQSEWGGLDMPSIESRVKWMNILGNMIRNGWRVVLLINHELEEKTPAFSSRLYPDHYVGMIAAPVFTPAGDPLDVSDDLMSLTIFSHRREYDVGTGAKGVRRPQPLKVGEVMRYVWSYSAGRY